MRLPPSNEVENEFFYTGRPLFQGVSHDLSNISNISYDPPSCSSLVSHPFSLWPILINVPAVRRRLTIRELIIVLGC